MYLSLRYHCSVGMNPQDSRGEGILFPQLIGGSDRVIGGQGTEGGMRPIQDQARERHAVAPEPVHEERRLLRASGSAAAITRKLVPGCRSNS